MSLFDRMENNLSNSGDHEIWNEISGGEDLGTIFRNSEEKPQLIYKHSHRCSVCFMAKQELEDISDSISDIADLYMINVIHQRNLSNTIASELNIRHESPQVIILKDREILWKGSHWDVKGKDIMKRLTSTN